MSVPTIQMEKGLVHVGVAFGQIRIVDTDFDTNAYTLQDAQGMFRNWKVLKKAEPSVDRSLPDDPSSKAWPQLWAAECVLCGDGEATRVKCLRSVIRD